MLQRHWFESEIKNFRFAQTRGAAILFGTMAKGLYP
jgi:hypothetical protein